MTEEFKEKPIWISHRGYAVQYPENTREAFDESVLHGFLSLETDLRLTADNHIVLCHDLDLKRTMGRNHKVGEMSKGQLEALRFPNGETLMFLDDFVDRYKSAHWTFDVKPENADKTILKLFDAIEAHQMVDRINRGQLRFLFWQADHQQMFCDKYPKAQCYARVDECKRAGLSVLLGLSFLGGIKAHKVYSLPEKFLGLSCFQKKYVQRFHKAGARVLAFLPATEESALAASFVGCDEILTNGLRLEI